MICSWRAGDLLILRPSAAEAGGIIWGSAGIILPWEAYLQYDDKAILEEHYPAMSRYIEYLSTTIDKNTGLSTEIALAIGSDRNITSSAPHF